MYIHIYIYIYAHTCINNSSSSLGQHTDAEPREASGAYH